MDRGTRDTGFVTVDNLFENPARYSINVFLSVVKILRLLEDCIYIQQMKTICFS